MNTLITTDNYIAEYNEDLGGFDSAKQWLLERLRGAREREPRLYTFDELLRMFPPALNGSSVVATLSAYLNELIAEGKVVVRCKPNAIRPTNCIIYYCAAINARDGDPVYLVGLKFLVIIKKEGVYIGDLLYSPEYQNAFTVDDPVLQEFWEKYKDTIFSLYYDTFCGWSG